MEVYNKEIPFYERLQTVSKEIESKQRKLN